MCVECLLCTSHIGASKCGHTHPFLTSCVVLCSESVSHPVLLFVTPWTVAPQAPLSKEFSRQEYWSGLPFLSPGGLPNPGIKPESPALQADSLQSAPPGKPMFGTLPCPKPRIMSLHLYYLCSSNMHFKGCTEKMAWDLLIIPLCGCFLFFFLHYYKQSCSGHC